MLYLVLYAMLGLIIVGRIEVEGCFDDYVEEHDLISVSACHRRQATEVIYGLLIWIWPLVAIKSMIQIFL